MTESREQWALRVLSGEERGVTASLLRAGLSVAEPFYAGAMLARNALYDAAVLKQTKNASQPVISVGNLTTGGTGKTPVVRWLAEGLIEQNLRPAILMRGYRAAATGGSDEQRMLEGYLAGRAVVVADADRLAGARKAHATRPQPDVFILDDGFQHRRMRRDFDLVLINATEPFGYGHVLPRGLLREPIRGLKRADAVLVTHASEAIEDAADSIEQSAERQLTDIERTVRRYTSAPIFFADHAHVGLRGGDQAELLPMSELTQRRYFLFCGIGHPHGFYEQFQPYPEPRFAGFRAFADHHAYTAAELRELSAEARAAGAEVLVTTEKDWVKVRPLLAAAGEVLPILRTELEVRFRGGQGDELLALIMQRITVARRASSSVEAAAPPAAAEAS